MILRLTRKDVMTPTSLQICNNFKHLLFKIRGALVKYIAIQIANLKKLNNLINYSKINNPG